MPPLFASTAAVHCLCRVPFDFRSGGALFVRDCNLDVRSSRLDGNDALENGGALIVGLADKCHVPSFMVRKGGSFVGSMGQRARAPCACRTSLPASFLMPRAC